MGVSALFASTLAGIRRQLPDAEFIVFDSGLGERPLSLRLSEDETIHYTGYGARAGHRYYLPENLATMRLASRLGPLGRLVNPAIGLIDSCDVALDISGGDSFSDIYGLRRFNSVIRSKLIVLERGVPLILLPQTYGPYRDPRLRDLAAKVARQADMAWARDRNSFAILKNLLGDAYDAERHRSGVDVAFGLPSINASDVIGDDLRSWVERDGFGGLLVGVNVNGLIYNNPEDAVSHYGFKADYRRTVLEFITWLLEQTDSRVVLIPHVMVSHGSFEFESDHAASVSVAKALPPEHAGRVVVSPLELDQSQVKWLISKMDWFVGTRLHSTIAGISSGVATVNIAYSDKAKGVFESCGLGEHVLDPRVLDTGNLLTSLRQSFEQRETARRTLADELPKVKARAEDQMKSIADRILALVRDKPRRAKG